LRADVFVTAAHCLDGTSLDDLWINHFGGPPPHLFSQAQRVELVPNADTAMIVTDAPNAEWVLPFQFVQFAANLGERVCALGYPNQTLQLDAPAKETLRFFRGTVQRPFIHRSAVFANVGYSAYELSFPCPSGLSGGPLFLEDDPRTVIGVVTENLEAGTLLHEHEEVVEEGQRSITHTQIHRIINYGVAANLIEAADVLESVLGRPLPTHVAGQHPS